ncbi:hypothetical protein ABPG74_011296 [Tetrahymena malaccensis]
MFAQTTQTQQKTQLQSQGLFSLPKTSDLSQQLAGQNVLNTTQNAQNGLKIQTPQQQSGSLFQTGSNTTSLFQNSLNLNNQQNNQGQNSWTCAPPVEAQKLDTQQQKTGLFQTNQNMSLNLFNNQNKNIPQGQVLSNQQTSIFNQQPVSSNNRNHLLAPGILNSENSQFQINSNNILQQENQALKERIQQMDQRISDLEKQVQKNSGQDQKIVELENNFKLLAQFCSQNFKGLCNKGHILDHCTNLLAQYFFCNVCKQSLKDTGLGSYRCQVCDFDRCDKCYNENRLI